MDGARISLKQLEEMLAQAKHPNGRGLHISEERNTHNAKLTMPCAIVIKAKVGPIGGMELVRNFVFDSGVTITPPMPHLAIVEEYDLRSRLARYTAGVVRRTDWEVKTAQYPFRTFSEVWKEKTTARRDWKRKCQWCLELFESAWNKHDDAEECVMRRAAQEANLEWWTKMEEDVRELQHVPVPRKSKYQKETLHEVDEGEDGRG